MFLCVTAFSLALVFTQLYTGWVPGTFSPRIKRMEREAKHSRPVVRLCCIEPQVCAAMLNLVVFR